MSTTNAGGHHAPIGQPPKPNIRRDEQSVPSHPVWNAPHTTPPGGYSTQTYHPGFQAPQAKKPLLHRPMTWVVIAFVIILAICGIASRYGDANNTIAPITEISADAASPEVPPVSRVVDGNGNSVVQIGAELNGAFLVDYNASYNALIINFLNSAGDSGASWEDVGINEFAMDGPLTGQVVMHLSGVTMVQASNTEGAWSLKFTPLG